MRNEQPKDDYSVIELQVKDGTIYLRDTLDGYSIAMTTKCWYELKEAVESELVKGARP